MRADNDSVQSGRTACRGGRAVRLAQRVNQIIGRRGLLAAASQKGIPKVSDRLPTSRRAPRFASPFQARPKLSAHQ